MRSLKNTYKITYHLDRSKGPLSLLDANFVRSHLCLLYQKSASQPIIWCFDMDTPTLTSPATPSTATFSPATMTPATVLADVQLIIAYEFHNPSILLEALRGAGCGLSLFHSPHALDGDKRLALLGDTVLRTALLADWYNSNSDRCKLLSQEIERSTNNQLAIGNRRVSSTCSTANLSERGHLTGLDRYISTNPSQRGDPPSAGTTASAVQALLGSIWMDSQYCLRDVRQSIQVLGLARSG